MKVGSEASSITLPMYPTLLLEPDALNEIHFVIDVE